MSLTVRKALAALAVPSLLLTGCGSSDSRTANDPVASSSPLGGATTGDTTASRILDKDTFAAATAKAVENTSARARQDIDMGLMRFKTEGEIGTTDAGPVMRLATTPDSQMQMTMVLVDGVMYMQGAELPLPEGKWLRLDPAEIASGDNPLAAFSGMLDPASLVKDLGVIEDVEHLGSEQVDGVEAEHYRVTTDTAGALDKLGLDKLADDPQLGSVIDGVLEQMPDELALDVWLDAQDRPVRYHQEMEIMGFSLTMEQHFYDYGVEVDVTAPDRKDTVGVDELSGS